MVQLSHPYMTTGKTIALIIWTFVSTSGKLMFNNIPHYICFFIYINLFELPSDGKASVYNVGDLGSIPGSGRFPGEGNGTPLQYYCLENPMDGGAW